MGELITDWGVGNGVSLLILADITAGMPAWGANTLRSITDVIFATMIVAVLILIIGVIFIEQGQRRIPMWYTKRMVDRHQYSGSSTHLPLKVNQTDVIPVIFASSLIHVLVLITQIVRFGQPNPNMDNWWQRSVTWYLLAPSSWQYTLLFFLMTIFSSFFCTSMQYDPYEQVENMRKYGGFISGFRPGRLITEYLSYVLIYPLIIDSLYLTLVAVLPDVALDMGFGNADAGTGDMSGSTALLILVSVALATVK